MTALATQHSYGSTYARGYPTRTTDLQEQFQVGVFSSIVAAAGCIATVSPIDDGIDVRVVHELSDISDQITVNVQLKCTSHKLVYNGDYLPVQIKKTRYDQMRQTGKSAPFILVAHQIPENRDDWITVDHGGNLLSKESYWVNLTGLQPQDESGDRITVHVPTSNIFDDAELVEICAQIREGEFPR